MTVTGAPTKAAAKDPEQIPGGGDMWFFVLFESLVFTSYFCVYLYSRTQHEHAFLEAQSALNLPLGVLDTVVLLTSSWAIASCVHNSRAGRYRVANRLAIAAVGLGVIFSALKLVEWVRLIHEGNTFTSSYFMQYYFFLTGMHAIHLLIGFVALGVLLYRLSDSQRGPQESIEACATYWHTVDLFWVLIFAMLYVVR